MKRFEFYLSGPRKIRSIEQSVEFIDLYVNLDRSRALQSGKWRLHAQLTVLNFLIFKVNLIDNGAVINNYQ